MIDKGQWWEFNQDTGVTPLLCTRSAMGFLMTTESQDLCLTSHPKDGWVLVALATLETVALMFFHCLGAQMNGYYINTIKIMNCVRDLNQGVARDSDRESQILSNAWL